MVHCQRYHTFASFCQEFCLARLQTSLEQESICQQLQQENPSSLSVNSLKYALMHYFYKET